MEIQFLERYKKNFRLSLLILLALNILGCLTKNLANNLNKTELGPLKKVSPIMNIEIEKEEEDFFKNDTTLETILRDLNFKNITSTHRDIYKIEYKLELNNEHAFLSTITKFIIDSKRLIYLNFTDIRGSLMIENEGYLIYNLTSLELYLKNKLKENSINISHSEKKLNYILLLDNLEYLQLLQTFIYHNQLGKNFSNLNYDAMIYYNNTVPLNLIIQDIRHPVYESDESVFQSLKRISELKRNFKITIIYDNISVLIPINFLNSTSTFSIFVLIYVFVWWHIISFKIYNTNFSYVQKILTLILYIKSLITILLFIYLSILDRDIATQNIFEEMFLLTSAITASTIYKTVLLFTIILLSDGWKIISESFSRSKLQKLVIIYMIIYFSLCFDQMIDVSGNKIGKFLPSELKNIMMNFIVGVYVIKNSRANLRFLKDKLVYAFEYSTDHVISLRIKIVMMLFLSIYSFLYCFLLGIMNCSVRFYLGEIEDQYLNAIILIIWNNLEMLFLIILLYIFRPRNFPQNFNVFYLNGEEVNSVMESKPINVYVARVDVKPNIYAEEISIFNNKKFLEKNKNLPIIIVNPIDPIDGPRNFDIKQICVAYLSNN